MFLRIFQRICALWSCKRPLRHSRCRLVAKARGCPRSSTRSFSANFRWTMCSSARRCHVRSDEWSNILYFGSRYDVFAFSLCVHASAYGSRSTWQPAELFAIIFRQLPLGDALTCCLARTWLPVEAYAIFLQLKLGHVRKGAAMQPQHPLFWKQNC